MRNDYVRVSETMKTVSLWIFSQTPQNLKAIYPYKENYMIAYLFSNQACKKV